MMSLSIRKTASELFSVTKWVVRRESRLMCAVAQKVVENVEEDTVKERTGRCIRKPSLAQEYRQAYPEFLPDPKPEWRNSLREKLERMDMIKRRNQIDIPEFYVGSILAVTISDPHAQGKTNKFVGICIERKGCGLRADFTLRNVVDHHGVEVRYDLYDPTIQKIQVLRLEKRLDDKLLYLRDALPEYSTFPFDMEPEVLPEGAPVPINPLKVQLKKRPWVERWERQDLKGVKGISKMISKKMKKNRILRREPWVKYDLMKEYRKTIPEEEQNEVWSEVQHQLQQLQIMRKKMSRKRTFTLSKPQLT